MTGNAVVNLPLESVIRTDIAVPLRRVLGIYTVGDLILAWNNPRSRGRVARLFDSAVQAQHAAATCASWINPHQVPPTVADGSWWKAA